jgi:hypothetical protein
MEYIASCTSPKVRPGLILTAYRVAFHKRNAISVQYVRYFGIPAWLGPSHVPKLSELKSPFLAKQFNLHKHRAQAARGMFAFFITQLFSVRTCFRSHFALQAEITSLRHQVLGRETQIT